MCVLLLLPCKQSLSQSALHVVQRVSERADRDGQPCMREADLLVRSLLDDPSLGYMPPFIVLHQMARRGECPHKANMPYPGLNCWSR